MTTYTFPFHQACLAGNAEQVLNLLQQDPHLVDAKDHEDTPLHCAATEAVARLLIAWNADVNARGWMGQTPLHVAVAQGKKEIVALLIQHGAHVNAKRERGDIPLHWVKTVEIAQMLIEHGADLEARDFSGAEPLHWAVRNTGPEVVRLLIRSGADIHACTKDGETPLYQSVENRNPDRLAIVRMLLEAGADVNRPNNSTGFTPLHEVIWRSHSLESQDEEVVRLLLGSGADVFRRSVGGQAPWHLAKKKPALFAIFQEHIENNGLPSMTSPEQFVIEQVRVHPDKPEAVTQIKGAMLARWAPDIPPHLLTTVFTPAANFCDLAISPDGEIIAVAPVEEPVEFRRWSDLNVVTDGPLPRINGATALAFSPDGRWLALADRSETIQLIDRSDGRITATAEGGEWTFPLLFHPTATMLASACSFQGGGHVRLDQINSQGELIPRYEWDRSNYRTPPNDFVDSLVHLAFSPDGHWLALFETSQIYHEAHPPGWRGNVVLYSVETGALHWQTSLDAHATGDERDLRTAGFPMGFLTELLFVSSTEIACGATHGVIVCYDVATGKVTRNMVLPTNAAIRSLSLNKDKRMLWVVLDNGKLLLHPL